MTMPNANEYLRRNILHASSVGVQANIGVAIDRLVFQKHPPKWLLKLLDKAHNQAYDVSKEMAKHRDEVKP